MVVLAQIMVVQLNQCLHRLLHGAHLDQCHLAVLPAGGGVQGGQRSSGRVKVGGWRGGLYSLEELEAFDHTTVAGEEALEVIL